MAGHARICALLLLLFPVAFAALPLATGCAPVARGHHRSTGDDQVASLPASEDSPARSEAEAKPNSEWEDVGTAVLFVLVILGTAALPVLLLL